MKKDTERIERYLSSVEAPQYECGQHRHELRRRILVELGGRQTTCDRMRSWRYAAVIALIGTGVVAGAVGITIHKYRVMERRPGYGYLVQSEDGQSNIVISDGNGVTPEQAVKEAAELALLKQQGKRELVGAIETAVNGRHDVRVLSYRYTLPDGRTVYMGERDPDDTGPVILADERLQTALRELDTRGVVVAPYERTIQGRTFSFDVQKVALDNGMEVVRADGKPKEAKASVLHGEEATWTLEQSLDMPELDPPAVQWAIVDENPLSDFIQRLEKNRRGLATRVNVATDRQRDAVRYAQISVNWDIGFRKITADNLYLLTPAPRGTFSLRANTPAGTKWVVTKVVTIDKKPFCWCVPIEAKGGRSIPVVLNKESILDLTQVYDKVMNSKAPTE
ncbi:MAG: hypothetical protein KBE65_22490 [Phycisphaerae bacterium]|nr:hypothetical protein [Phycisphaerae bacterium]